MIDVSIVIPVLNKLEFTRQCLDRIWRNSGDAVSYEVIIVDNASTDGTAGWFAGVSQSPKPLRYERNATNLGFGPANNAGARLSDAQYLLFLNNDTLVQPGWLTEMVRVMRSSGSVGIVGIKQLFPYTNTIYHTGIVFGPDGRPEHLYPHLDASLPWVNRQREYQAVMGACLLIERRLFDECGGFDDGYRNGYEDVDLCLAAGQRGRSVVCCTSAYIYHYGQISEGRTADDDRNAARFMDKWSSRVRPDRDDYLVRDRVDRERAAPQPGSSGIRRLADDCIYLADDLDQGSALTWINAELALTLQERGVPVFISGAPRSPTLPASTRQRLAPLALPERPAGGIQIKWSHYWPRHLALELAGDLNLEFFVINYLFGSPGAEPWDYWLQCLQQNGYEKLPLSDFCTSVLAQVGVPPEQCHVLHPGYSVEIRDVEPPRRSDPIFRFLTVTNSHDLERYNTAAIIDAYVRVFGADERVALVIKDYGASSGDTTIREAIARRAGGARIDYLDAFTDKRDLIRLYKSADAFVSAHRGEGFGMKILDAMACGLPVLTPLFGGPTTYCTTETCYPIEFSLAPMGDCLDSRSLSIGNRPLWAEPSARSLSEQMRRVYDERNAAAALGARARDTVVDRFSWTATADRLVAITGALRANRPGPRRPIAPPAAPNGSQSPYWLGIRISVVVPTYNRKEKLLACLDRLSRQSILPQEFEVLVVDDGSSDGTREAIDGRGFPFALRYFRQASGGPGTARNLGVDQAAGELVLFIGDDILAEERLLEEHLLAHASRTEPGAAILGRIDWPEGMPTTAVMEYVCGDAALQFAYSVIPSLPVLDHRFFYTSNISLKRAFLVGAADAGIRFDPAFRHAAFEDSEFAFRLLPRGLTITYVERARARHDHWMDLESFSAREFRAGEMAVVFYRKHPGQDDQLQVRWMADLSGPVERLLQQPEFLERLEAFDLQTSTLINALAGSLEALLALAPQLESDLPALSSDRLRHALHNVLRVIFDVQRTRGKVQEWFSMVDDPAKTRAAQMLASVRRKIAFLNLDDTRKGLLGTMAPFDARVTESLSGRIGSLDVARPTQGQPAPRRRTVRQAFRSLARNPVLVRRLLAADRLVQDRLQTSARRTWLDRYLRARRRVRDILM